MLGPNAETPIPLLTPQPGRKCECCHNVWDDMCKCCGTIWDGMCKCCGTIWDGMCKCCGTIWGRMCKCCGTIWGGIASGSAVFAEALLTMIAIPILVCILWLYLLGSLLCLGYERACCKHDGGGLVDWLDGWVAQFVEKIAIRAEIDEEALPEALPTSEFRYLTNTWFLMGCSVMRTKRLTIRIAAGIVYVALYLTPLLYIEILKAARLPTPPGFQGHMFMHALNATPVLCYFGSAFSFSGKTSFNRFLTGLVIGALPDTERRFRRAVVQLRILTLAIFVAVMTMNYVWLFTHVWTGNTPVWALWLSRWAFATFVCRLWIPLISATVVACVCIWIRQVPSRFLQELKNPQHEMDKVMIARAIIVALRWQEATPGRQLWFANGVRLCCGSNTSFRAQSEAEAHVIGNEWSKFHQPDLLKRSVDRWFNHTHFHLFPIVATECSFTEVTARTLDLLDSSWREFDALLLQRIAVIEHQIEFKNWLYLNMLPPDPGSSHTLEAVQASERDVRTKAIELATDAATSSRAVSRGSKVSAGQQPARRAIRASERYVRDSFAAAVKPVRLVRAAAMATTAAAMAQAVSRPPSAEALEEDAGCESKWGNSQPADTGTDADVDKEQTRQAQGQPDAAHGAESADSRPADTATTPGVMDDKEQTRQADAYAAAAADRAEQGGADRLDEWAFTLHRLTVEDVKCRFDRMWKTFFGLFITPLFTSYYLLYFAIIDRQFIGQSWFFATYAASHSCVLLIVLFVYLYSGVSEYERFSYIVARYAASFSRRAKPFGNLFVQYITQYDHFIRVLKVPIRPMYILLALRYGVSMLVLAFPLWLKFGK